MVEGLSELLAACGVHKPTSPAERIAEGETHWFIGYAAAAPEGMVALSQTETLKLLFRKEDVSEVRRHGERFLVRVSDGANMLISFEQVIKAAPTCSCGDGSYLYSTAEGPKPTPVIDVDDWNVGGCRVRIECSTVNIPLLGPTRVCLPTSINCGDGPTNGGT